MSNYASILISAGFEKFTEIVNASPRQAKEAYFKRHAIRAKAGGSSFMKPGEKMRLRIEQLFGILNEAPDDELCEEILRAWLLSKRNLLAHALDYLEIPHNNGLTEADLTKFEKLSGREAKKLATHLKEIAVDDDIRIYFSFMGVPDTNKIFKN